MWAESKSIEKQIQPLYKHFGINGCYYMLIYETGETLCLTSHSELDERHTKAHLANQHRFSIIDYLKMFPSQGYYLIDTEPSIQKQRDPLVKQLFLEYDLCHDCLSVNIVETPRGRAIRLVFYFAPKDRVDMNRFYLNHLDLLTRFNRHLSQSLEDLVKRIPLIVPLKQESELAQYHLRRFANHSNNTREYGPKI